MKWFALTLTALLLTAASLPPQHWAEHPRDHNSHAKRGEGVTEYKPLDLPRVEIIDSVPRTIFIPSIPAPDLREASSEDSAAANHTAEHDPEGIKWTDKVVAVFTIVLGLAAIVSGVIAYFQWQALIGQDKRLKESIDKAEAASGLQAAGMNRSIEESTKAANAMVALAQNSEITSSNSAKSIEFIKKYNTIASRAYVFVFTSQIDNIDSREPPLTASLRFKNLGQTPARNIHFWGGMSYQIPPDIFSVPTPERTRDMTITLGPGGETTKIYKLSIWGTAGEWHREKLQSGEAAIFVYGKVTYTDVFNEEHFTKFKFIFGGPHGLYTRAEPGGRTGILSQCEDGNEND